MNKLKENYNNACNAYLKAFCDKHDFDYDDAKKSWVSNQPGTICMCGDYYVQLEDMMTDIDNNAPEEEYIKYYDYTLECCEYGIPSPNYKSWLCGCPILSDEQRKSLRAAKNRVELAKKELEKCIEEKKQSLVGGF